MKILDWIKKLFQSNKNSTQSAVFVSEEKKSFLQDLEPTGKKIFINGTYQELFIYKNTMSMNSFRTLTFNSAIVSFKTLTIVSKETYIDKLKEIKSLLYPALLDTDNATKANQSIDILCELLRHDMLLADIYLFASLFLVTIEENKNIYDTLYNQEKIKALHHIMDEELWSKLVPPLSQMNLLQPECSENDLETLRKNQLRIEIMLNQQ